MAVRAIDAVQVLHNINVHHRPTPVSEFESGFNDGLNQAMWEITHAPTLTQPNEWVSVEERLPEKKQDVLMLFDGGNMAVVWWHDSDEYITFWCAYTDDGFYTDCDDMPVYWMPLPKPPTEEEA